MTLKEKSYFVVLNRKVEEELSSMTLEKTRFGERLDLTDLPAIDMDGGSKLIVAGVVGGCSVLVLLLGTLVVRTYKRRGGGKKYTR